MILQRQIVLKAVVTEQLKEQLIQDLEANIQRIEAEQEELDRQTRRMMLELQRTDLNRAMQFRQQLEVEKRRQDGAKAEIQEQLDAVRGLQLGEIVIRGTVQGQVEVAVGDSFSTKMARAEILLEDDIIKEINDPAPD